jgi:hypothetical protein
MFREIEWYQKETVAFKPHKPLLLFKLLRGENFNKMENMLDLCKLTAMEKDAYDNPLARHILWSLPNGFPSSSQTAGIIITRRFPKFPKIYSKFISSCRTR